jgi:dTMP kinase
MSAGHAAPGRGVLVAIEGIDGSGKGTQAARLCDALRQRGTHTELISFPRYSETFFGARIGDFLNGRFGSLEEVHPFLAATLFAGDRMESRDMLLGALASHEVVVLDRYVASNIAHQAGKREGVERSQMTDWIRTLEFEVHQLPRPDLVILLDLSASRAQTLIAKKKARSYTDRAADLQEADEQYLENVRRVYLDLARAEDNWSVVDVERGGELRSVEDVAGDVWERVRRCVGLGE